MGSGSLKCDLLPHTGLGWYTPPPAALDPHLLVEWHSRSASRGGMWGDGGRLTKAQSQAEGCRTRVPSLRFVVHLFPPDLL